MLIFPTARGADVEAVADFPPGAGPFAAIVLAPGQSYHLGLPALQQTAMRLVSEGIGVYRFNWAYYSASPDDGLPSFDLADEFEDMMAVIAAARAEPRVDAGRLSVGGKSLGSLVAWRALAADPSLQCGLLLTPVCSPFPGSRWAPALAADENYPGIGEESRPLLFIAGDSDPLCLPAALYRFAANARGPARVAVIGGNHTFDNPLLDGAAAHRFRLRSFGAVAQLSADFVAEVSGSGR